MANRVIRDWTASESVDELSPKAEVFFTRLIMKADDYGNYTGNPRLIAAALFPLKMYDIQSVMQWMEECEKQGLIVMYTNGGKKYIHIPNFGQTLRRMKAVYPAPNIDGSLRTSVGQAPSSVSETPPETKGNEDETETETETKAREIFDDLFLRAFDDQTCESYKLAFRGYDLAGELQKFRIKCDNDKSKYYERDVGGLRTAFQYQLQNLRQNGKRKSGTIDDANKQVDEILNRGFAN